jgi:3-mercaptopyruvate sulfurtransferase SseA
MHEATSARVARELIQRGMTDVRALEGGWQAWLDLSAGGEVAAPARA